MLKTLMLRVRVRGEIEEISDRDANFCSEVQKSQFMRYSSKLAGYAP